MGNQYQWFDMQEWTHNDLANKAATQDLKTGAMEQDVAQMKIDLAYKAMVAQGEIEEKIKKIPNLAQKASENPSGLLADLAAIEANVGHVQESADLLARSASAGEASNRSMLAKTQDDLLAAQTLGSAMRGVETEITKGVDPKVAWERANMYLRSVLSKEHTEKLDWLRDLPEENPSFDYLGVSRQIATISVSAEEAANIEQSRASAEFQRQSAAESKVRTETVIPAQVKLIEAQTAAEEKVGALRSAGRAATLSDAKARIQADFEVDDPNLNVLAMQVAEDSESVLAEQPTLGRTAALESAYQSQRENVHGIFAGLTKKAMDIGSNPENPKALPIVDGDFNPDRLEPNKYYLVPPGLGKYSGRTVLWDGKEFNPVPKKVGH